MAIHNARRYRGDKLIRTATPHRILDPAAGPLIAVKLNILTRKTLGGLQTDLACRVLRADGTPLPGLYAAGEVAGFGGGGVHGYRSLEGTFLGGCLFGGRQAGRSAALASRLVSGNEAPSTRFRARAVRPRRGGRTGTPARTGNACAASHSACSRVSTPSATTSSPIPVPRLISPSTSDALVAFAGTPATNERSILNPPIGSLCSAVTLE